MTNEKYIWITWERQTRNRSMANLMSARYVEFSYANKWLRYFVLSIKTLSFFIKNKPEVIFFQNPSVVLGLVCVFYGSICRKTFLIADYHNCALDTSSRLYGVNSFIAKRSRFVIVTNPSMESVVSGMGGKSISFPDPLPEVDGDQARSVERSKNILFVTSWANDEPINEVLDAFIDAGLCKSGISLLMTGRPKFSNLAHDKNHYETFGVTFLGFVSEQEYWSLLGSAYFVIDLTTRDNCMVCGAYEALAVNRPLLLSNNKATINYFGSGLIYTDNTKEDIQNKITYMCGNIELLNARVLETVGAVLVKQHENVLNIKHLIKENS